MDFGFLSLLEFYIYMTERSKMIIVVVADDIVVNSNQKSIMCFQHIPMCIYSF